MATYTERLQRVWHEFEREHGKAPVTAREAVLWGVERGLIRLPPPDPLAKVSEDMSRALRAECGVDAQGRRYRKNIAVRVFRGGAQYTIWSRLADAPPEFVRESFAQRRAQIIGDCAQLDIDAAAWNGLNPGQRPIQLSFDFTREVLARRDEQAGLFDQKAA